MRLPWEQHLVFSLKKKVLQTASRINSTLSRSFSAPVALNKQNDNRQRGEHAMTFIQQFIEKAFVGGWQPGDHDCRIIRFYEHYFEYQPIFQGRSSTIRMMVYEAVLLNPKVCQAVGKVEKWYEGRYGPEWLHHMRKMIDALAEGQTLEAYIQSVLQKSHTKEV